MLQLPVLQQYILYYCNYNNKSITTASSTHTTATTTDTAVTTTTRTTTTTIYNYNNLYCGAGNFLWAGS